MIAIDASSFIAYLSGSVGDDVEAIETVLEQKQAVLPPAVVSEILSDPKIPSSVVQLIKEIPQLSIEEGYWESVGRLRAKLLAKSLKARLADALIAQSCLDHDVPLITRDSDFESFEKIGGLKLI